MVYVIIDDEKGSKVMLVKVEKREEVDQRLRLPDTAKILGCLTQSEIRTLDSASFAAISA